MSEKADIVYLLRAGQSIRSIQRETGVHRTIVRRLRELAQEAGWLAVDRLPPEAEEITRAVAQANPKLLEADAIVLATPGYFEMLSGRLKNFLDRTRLTPFVVICGGGSKRATAT